MAMSQSNMWTNTKKKLPRFGQKIVFYSKFGDEFVIGKRVWWSREDNAWGYRSDLDDVPYEPENVTHWISLRKPR